MSTTAPPTLYHTTLNSPTLPSLLLLHGIFCSSTEFDTLTPHLSSFHIILVDLPGHTRSRSPTLNALQMPETVDMLADIIRTISPSGRAHVAGMSYGAFHGLELARRHPDAVLSLFASGGAPFEGKQRWVASRPWAMGIVNGVSTYMPDTLYWLLCRQMGVLKHAELRAESKANYTNRNGYADCLSITLKEVGEIRGVRTCVVAGGLQDNVDVTRRMGGVLRDGGGEECRAFVVRKAIHGWDLQFPELFAEGIRCWAEGRGMPDKYEELL